MSIPMDRSSSRRDFLRTATSLAVASPLLAQWSPLGASETAADKMPISETFVTELYKTLTTDQKQVLCFASQDALREKALANWAITKQTIGDLTPVQQDLVGKIVRGLTSEEGYEKFQKQMEDDGGGLPFYHIAIFGTPGSGDCEFVLTGRHVTMRADGDHTGGAAFGGPMVYGHDPGGFDEPPDHPGNVFWYQGKRANEVFAALNTEQRQQALVGKAPREEAVQHRDSNYPGLRVGSMSNDQQQLVQAVMQDLLSPYREQDAKEVMEVITANGGLEKIHLAFFQNHPDGKSADIGNDSVWDIWRLEGPGFVWHFRGAPHVHTWVNIARRPKAQNAS